MPSRDYGRMACNQLLMKISCRALSRRQQAMKVVPFEVHAKLNTVLTAGE
jgi:hypothetical protein